MLGVVAAVETLRVSETRVDMVEDDFLDADSPSFLSFLNNWLLVLLMFLTKLFTRSRFRVGDAFGSRSGLEWFGFGLNPDISGDGKGDVEGEGEESGEDLPFMMLLMELVLARLWSGKGEVSSSEKEMVELERFAVSGGR